MYPAQPTSLHRTSTDTRASLATIRMPTQPVASSSPSSTMPVPDTPAHLHPPTLPSSSAPRPARRNTTTGSPIKQHQHQHQRLYQRFPHPGQQQQLAPEEAVILGDAAHALADDIQIHSEQIRRERQSKRQKQLQQAEAEAALTRTDTRGTRGTRDDDDKPLVGNLIGEDHVNYVLMYNMLTGIRIGVSRCQAKIKRTLTEDDFVARHKYSFDIVGNELTPSAKYDFKFKDYAPFVFRSLREEFFRLDPADYLLSLTAKYILSELGSPGKSGSFFYFSRDYRFIIKTIHHSEHKFLLKTLGVYYEHVKSNPHTLLSRFYGLHRVKLPRGRKIHFVIMNNLFPPHRDIHETYDLKGSTVGREYPEEKAKKNPRAVLKDLNWINRGKELELGPEKRALLAEQLRRDVEYLKSVDVMDYSLLVGIHNMKRGNRDNVRKNTLKVFEPELPQGPRSKQSARGTKTPEAIAMRRAMRSSDPKALSSASAGLFLDEDTTGDRQYFIFYQDEGGLQATDEENKNMSTIYYLGVIDILTPFGFVKRAEGLWKSILAGSGDRKKISQVPPNEYGSRFLAFMRAFMKGGEGGARFK
ncbi:SAICAR synthase-like protein [Macrolepiota fuliginosa MF-IS2]|uniref:1-phosphatidylinositol-4-phosphate 5-kinase n=1 Tax=Macrolepiota fuliginosa MF-IS2 TaxID=1400762 RepID=A0A9P5XA57_9AGAR|nr:SAICAR synthase-like protein [Macrolepiota fuliginosa MF-IS2]